MNRQNGRILSSWMPAIKSTCTALLANHCPPASLVHGDLWGGNVGTLLNGRPVIYDPAAYYGDREVDLAMTQLFGGFSAEFYQSYHNTWPLPSGHEHRVALYNLYHLLNHFNLFGGSYLDQSLNSIEQLCKTA